MTNLLKLQFCNEYVKTSKLDSFLKCTEPLSSTVIQINTEGGTIRGKSIRERIAGK